jgi:hypothetical protein
MYFLPLGLAFTYRAVKKATEKNETRSADLRTKPETNSKYINSKPSKTSLLLGFKKLFFKPNSEFRIPYSFFAFLFLTLTTAGHLGIGIIGLLSTIPFLFLDLNKTNLIARGKTLFVIYIGHMIALAYWIIPVFLYTDYHMVSFWDPIWKFDSYGWYEVGRQLVAGEIFDWKRAPIITFYVILGFFVLLADSSLFPFALSFLLMMLIYFGRNTWGGLVDFVPGMKDFHMHRFVVGVHIASIFLIPSALEALFKLIIKFKEKLINLISKLLGSDRTGNINTSFTVIIYLFTLSLLSVAVYYTVRQTVDYASFNNRWIGEANKAFQYDEKNFYALTDYLETLPPARTYAGRPGNWGHQFRLGSSQLYMLLSAYGFDVSQFLPETWSPMSENDQNFDERYLKDYELLNLKYIVSTENHGFPEEAVMDKKFGPFELYKVPTSGWFDVVTSPMLVKTDKTNFINLVHYWHRGFPRTWKMHPFITLKDIETPYRMQRIIEMKDEVTYEENRSEKNIFSDFPFVFPESTPSGKIINEKVTKQTYSSTVEVPENCKDCMIMFKMSYHPNWKASVDGKNAATYSVFPFYLAVKAESGTHEIVFTHKPNNLKIIVLTIQILIPCAAVIFYLRKKRA